MSTTARTPTRQASTRELLGRGALGGAVAGVIFGVANMWFASSNGQPAAMPLKMIATIVQGSGALESGSANAVLGGVVHMTLSIAFGVVLALLVSRIANDAARAAVGLAYGLGLYLVNFLIISPLAFPVFQKANQPFEAVVHVVFGAIAVLFLLGSRPAPSR